MPKTATIKLGNVNSRIFGYLPDEVMDALYEKLSYKNPNSAYISKVIDGKWDGVTRLFNRYKKVFNTGLLSDVRKILKDHDFQVEIEDQRVKPQRMHNWQLILSGKIESLYDFQEEAIYQAKKAGRGAFAMPTASGKTLAFTGMIAEIGVSPVIIYVPSLLLLYQTKNEIEKYLRDKDGKTVDVGIVGDGQCDVKDITVMTIQTAITALDMEYNSEKDTITYLTPEQIQLKNKQLQQRRKKRSIDDDPDADEDLSFVVTRKDVLQGLIQNAKMIVCDECFQYNTLVLMPDGKYEKLGKLVRTQYEGDVMSWNIKKKIMEPQKVIGHIRKKPTAPMVMVKTGESGGVTCTNNHLFLTDNGWKMAKDLKRHDLIIMPDMTNSNSSYILPEDVRQMVLGSSLGDGHLRKAHKTVLRASLSITHCLKQKEYLEYKMSFFNKIGGYIISDAKSGFIDRLQAYGITKNFADIYNMCNMSRTERIRKLDILGLAIWYLDDGSFTPKNGTSHISVYSLNYEECIEVANKMKDFDININIYNSNKGYVIYIPRIYMEVFSKLIYKYTPKCMEYKLSPIEYNDEKFDTNSIIPLNYKYNIVNTVIDIDDFQGDVFCLDVAKNHNFITKTGVVHNCHRASSVIYQEVLKQSVQAYYRMAVSGTMKRQDNSEILIQATFGRKLIDISPSELIRRGVIVRPYVFMVGNPESQNEEFSTFDQIRKNYVVQSETRNRLLTSIAARVKEYGAVLMLVGIISHGEALEKMIPGSMFICSKTPEKKKKQALEDLMSGELPILIATSIADEGLNLPDLRVLFICDGGKAENRLYQRIGRVSRKFENKNFAIVIDIKDKNKKLAEHAQQREMIYLNEEEYIITHVGPERFRTVKGL
jgi:superfamily II DNA or RNA helicase